MKQMVVAGLMALVVSGHVEIAVAGADGDPIAGKRLFAQCLSCHTIAEGEPGRIGPNLHGIFTRKAASAADFVYSDAMKSSGIVWTQSELDAYIKSPSARVPGNKMAFMGVGNNQQRADITSYLEKMSP
jgi:cytochrome c